MCTYDAGVPGKQSLVRLLSEGYVTAHHDQGLYGRLPVKALYIAIGIWFTVIGGRAALADGSCEQAYRDLKLFEDQHQLDSAAAIDALRKGDHCSELVLNFEEKVDANSRSIARLARSFVTACRDDPSKAADLAYYGLDGVLNPPPSTLRERCKSGK
jgi:hypothetical protein